MTTWDLHRWGGIAFTLGVVIFLLSRFRHLVGTPEGALWLLIPAGFALWIVGLIAFRARYGPRARGLGRSGLDLAVAGIVLLAVGHVGLLLHLLGPSVIRDIAGAGFVPVLLGTVLLAVGALLFGIDALRGDVLPRLHAAPLVTGLVGLAWMIFANDSRPDGTNPEAFIAMRTLFGLGWLVVALVFATHTDPTRVPRPRGPSRRHRSAGSTPDLERATQRGDGG
jgi:hypothetical protein